jgi:hypothetical protein
MTRRRARPVLGGARRCAARRGGSGSDGGPALTGGGPAPGRPRSSGIVPGEYGNVYVMTILTWRPVAEVRLREALIPDPAGTGTLDTVTTGRLAVDDGVLHVDPRPIGRTDPEATAYVVTAVPLAGVISFSYAAEGLHQGEAHAS